MFTLKNASNVTSINFFFFYFKITHQFASLLGSMREGRKEDYKSRSLGVDRAGMEKSFAGEEP